MTSEQITSWLESKEKDIRNTFLHHREYLMGKSADLSEFDFEKYKLSEMGLCVAVYSLNLPPGYISTKGEGRVIDTNNRQRFHVFAHDSEDNILCFTPGWFFINEPFFQHKGDAIRHVVNSAPGLVINFNDMIVLNGNRNSVYNALGLQYKW